MCQLCANSSTGDWAASGGRPSEPHVRPRGPGAWRAVASGRVGAPGRPGIGRRPASTPGGRRTRRRSERRTAASDGSRPASGEATTQSQPDGLPARGACGATPANTVVHPPHRPTAGSGNAVSGESRPACESATPNTPVRRAAAASASQPLRQHGAHRSSLGRTVVEPCSSGTGARISSMSQAVCSSGVASAFLRPTRLRRAGLHRATRATRRRRRAASPPPSRR